MSRTRSQLEGYRFEMMSLLFRAQTGDMAARTPGHAGDQTRDQLYDQLRFRLARIFKVLFSFTSTSFWKDLNPVFSRSIEYWPGATPVMVTGVKPFRSGLPALPSSERIKMTAAPVGVDSISIVPPALDGLAFGAGAALLVFEVAGVVPTRFASLELL